jgi:hypothetical protein
VLSTCFNEHEYTARVLLHHRQRSTGSLKQRGQLGFDKSVLLIRVADVAQRRSHVKRAARLTLKQHIVAA